MLEGGAGMWSSHMAQSEDLFKIYLLLQACTPTCTYHIHTGIKSKSPHCQSHLSWISL